MLGRWSMFNLNDRTADYFSRSQTILRKSVLPGNNMLGAGADSMNSLSPSNRKWRLCSVPFHSSFQEASTTVMRSWRSRRFKLLILNPQHRIAARWIRKCSTGMRGKPRFAYL